MKSFTPPRVAHGNAVLLVCASAMLMAAFNIPQVKAQKQEHGARHTNVNWPYYGNDLANTRFQNVDQITTSNASQLKVAWVFHTHVKNKNEAFEGTPLVINGTMYVTTGEDDVFALNAATGQELWEYVPKDMPPLSQLSICCSYDNRGVAYSNGLLFEARLDATLVAINASTGAQVWRAVVDNWQNGYSMTIAPQIVNGMVITGTSGGEYLTRGHVDAYDAATGAHIWRFYTTEPGTWAGNSYLQGGAPVWWNPSYDPTLGLLYITTGNAGPDINGVPRAGQNLYTVSIVALNSSTGTLAWYFQESHHDLWDYDATSTAVLFTLNGTPAIAHQGKTGYTFILNRQTGVPIYPVTEVPVVTTPAWQNPWPTQPETSIESMTPHYAYSLPPGYTATPMWTPPQETPLAMQPAADGGQEWPPDAYSPRTGFLYQEARYMPETMTTSPTNITGGAFPGWGSTLENILGVDYGVYGAVNPATGSIVWQIKTQYPADSGWVVAGDVAFFGESNGLFHGVNAATGDILWTFDATTIPGAGGATAGPAAYVANGREYIVNYFGGNPGELYAPLGDAVIAFALPE